MSWSETISSTMFLTLTVLLVHVGVADRKDVSRCQRDAFKVILTPWHFNMWRKFTFFFFGLTLGSIVSERCEGFSTQ